LESTDEENVNIPNMSECGTAVVHNPHLAAVAKTTVCEHLRGWGSLSASEVVLVERE
jgi:hypothetical protein